MASTVKPAHKILAAKARVVALANNAINSVLRLGISSQRPGVRGRVSRGQEAANKAPNRQGEAHDNAARQRGRLKGETRDNACGEASNAAHASVANGGISEFRGKGEREPVLLPFSNIAMLSQPCLNARMRNGKPVIKGGSVASGMVSAFINQANDRTVWESGREGNRAGRGQEAGRGSRGRQAKLSRGVRVGAGEEDDRE